jgi:hypothetical protein
MLTINRRNLSRLLIVLLALMTTAANAADWKFREIIVDNDPPLRSRITDYTVVDTNRAGRPDYL